MTSDGPQLLRTILEKPDDDAPRLIYADWLDDPDTAEEYQDLERAEFIRLQIRIANEMPPLHAERCNCKGCQLKKRERELWGYLPRKDGVLSKFKEYLPPGFATILPSDPGNGLEQFPKAVVRRGFVEKIECTHSLAETYLDEILKVQPVRTLRITDEVILGFGPLNATSVPVYLQNHTVITHKWSVLVGQSVANVRTRDFTRQKHISFLEIDSAKILPEIEFMRQTEGARTDRGYFRLRWPGVKVELPTRYPPTVLPPPARVTHSGLLIPPALRDLNFSEHELQRTTEFRLVEPDMLFYMRHIRHIVEPRTDITRHLRIGEPTDSRYTLCDVQLRPRVIESMGGRLMQFGANLCPHGIFFYTSPIPVPYQVM